MNNTLSDALSSFSYEVTSYVNIFDILGIIGKAFSYAIIISLTVYGIHLMLNYFVSAIHGYFPKVRNAKRSVKFEELSQSEYHEDTNFDDDFINHDDTSFRNRSYYGKHYLKPFYDDLEDRSYLYDEENDLYFSDNEKDILYEKGFWKDDTLIYFGDYDF